MPEIADDRQTVAQPRASDVGAPRRPPARDRRVRVLVIALDTIAIAGVLLAVTVALTGGFREWTPLGRLSVTSWIRPLIAALVAGVIRHFLQPMPSLPRNVATALVRAWRSHDVRSVLPVFLATRVGVFVVGFLAVVLFGYRPDVAVPWRIYENEILNLPARWDTGWYLGIAIEGYRWTPMRPDYQQNIAFFPVYPMLMRYGSLLLARQAMWTGVLISLASFFLALLYLFRWGQMKMAGNRAAAGIALLAAYPFALFFSAAYTESLFLLTIVAACYHFERNQLWKAAVWGLLAGLTRPNGCLLSIVLAIMALRPLWPNGWHPRWPAGGPMQISDRLAVAAAPGIGMLMYSTYIFFLTGHPFAWATQNAAWGRVYRGLGTLVEQQAQVIGDHGLYTYAATRTVDALQIMAVLLMLVTVWPVLRRFGIAYAAMILVNLLPPLMMGGLLSMGRVTSVLFPSFMWLGAAIPKRQRNGWVAGFAMLQAIAAAMFFTWRPLY